MKEADEMGPYGVLLNEIKQRIRTVQYEALRTINRELICLYWDIGRLIVIRQKREGWGKSIVERLAHDLQTEFPGMGGFSAGNLWRMRLFYQTYPLTSKLAPMVREIGWSHNILIFERCRNDEEREFYLRRSRQFGWTKNVLALQIDSKTYEKTLLNQTNFDKTVPASVRSQAKLAIKDEYLFGFLELGEEHAEKELERAIIARIEHFLREMGDLFAFLGRQFRLKINDKEYFIDLLLYHRALKCLIAVELKVGEFIPDYVGKMQFYLAALDDRVRLPEENPSVGIILCRSKDKTIVEYALKESRKPIGVASYRIVTELPKEFQGQLPAPEQIRELLSPPK